MPKFLELAQLAHGDGVSEVEIRRPGIVAAVHPQRAALLVGLHQALAELGCHRISQDIVPVIGALHQHSHLFVDIHSSLPD